MAVTAPDAAKPPFTPISVPAPTDPNLKEAEVLPDEEEDEEEFEDEGGMGTVVSDPPNPELNKKPARKPATRTTPPAVVKPISTDPTPADPETETRIKNTKDGVQISQITKTNLGKGQLPQNLLGMNPNSPAFARAKHAAECMTAWANEAEKLTWTVKVLRRGPPKHKKQRLVCGQVLDSFPIMAFIEFKKQVQEMFGGGKYGFQICNDDGRVEQGGDFELPGDPKIDEVSSNEDKPEEKTEAQKLKDERDALEAKRELNRLQRQTQREQEQFEKEEKERREREEKAAMAPNTEIVTMFKDMLTQQKLDAERAAREQKEFMMLLVEKLKPAPPPEDKLTPILLQMMNQNAQAAAAKSEDAAKNALEIAKINAQVEEKKLAKEAEIRKEEARLKADAEKEAAKIRAESEEKIAKAKAESDKEMAQIRRDAEKKSEAAMERVFTMMSEQLKSKNSMGDMIKTIKEVQGIGAALGMQQEDGGPTSWIQSLLDNPSIGQVLGPIINKVLNAEPNAPIGPQQIQRVQQMTAAQPAPLTAWHGNIAPLPGVGELDEFEPLPAAPNPPPPPPPPVTSQSALVQPPPMPTHVDHDLKTLVTSTMRVAISDLEGNLLEHRWPADAAQKWNGLVEKMREAGPEAADWAGVIKTHCDSQVYDEVMRLCYKGDCSGGMRFNEALKKLVLGE